MLAKAGAEGPAAIFEDRYGFLASYYDGGGEVLRHSLAGLGHEWETSLIAFKAYPACHFIHACLDATDLMLRTSGWTAADVDSIAVAVPKPVVPLVLEPREAKLRPRTEYDAKFSLPYSVASLVVRGRVDLTSYLLEALHDGDVLLLARRVSHVPREFETYPQAFPGWVRLTGRNGDVLEREVAFQSGAPENPLSTGEVIAKFRSNAGLSALPSSAAVEETLLELETLPALHGRLAPLRGDQPQELAV
jgi:2-methylcitrate dehydratase PrpD